VTTIEYEIGTVGPAAAPLRVTMLGLRGFPNVQGGVETHAQHLSSQLAELGCEVEAIVRSPYVARDSNRSWRNVRLVRIWSPRVKGAEAFIHTFLGVLRAGWTRPDILHIHAVGPALFTPLARALGLNVVVTHHVLNYENEKWGPIARTLLRLGERLGLRFANGRIAVSQSLAETMRARYRVPIRVIPNGINDPKPIGSTATLAAFGLSPNRYALTVARIDEQKRQLDLIEAFARAALASEASGQRGHSISPRAGHSPEEGSSARTRRGAWKLALVGGADYASEYARAVAQAAQQTEGVIMLGHQSGEALAELFTHAGVFVLPSSHEGQPIAVLEAMSYGCATILSDIPAHREIASPGAELVQVGDITALAERLDTVFRAETGQRLDEGDRERLMQIHDWQQIARRTLDVYRAALSVSRRS
jgi:glycosyltransferase involved in cell wall biosynthesis